MIDVAGLTVSLAEEALFLDIDGTLLDLAARPGDVVVPSALKAALAALSQAAGGALALVSGRPVAEIDGLFAPLKLPASGVHGAELRPDPAVAVERLAPRAPDVVRARAAAIAARHAGALFEDKGVSVAVHWRLAPNAGAAIAREIGALMATAPPGLTVLKGHSVLEIKASALDKGLAIDRFMERPPFAGRAPIFVGDDVTDEAGFAAAQRRGGRAFAVGRPMEGTMDWFESPAAVRRWLSMLAATPARAVA